MRDRLNQSLRYLPTWVIYMLGVLPAPWLFYQGLTGGLGVEPIKALEQEYGELTLQLLVLGLAITPLRKYAGLNLLKFRRAVGLLCFFYVTCHLLVWLLLDVQLPGQIVADIIKRPYITIGMAGFLLLLPLALTSNTWSIRRLGRNWQKLHRVIYVIAILGAVHFFLLVKGVQLEPLIYLAVIGGLLLLRLPGRRPSASGRARQQRA